MVVETIHPVTGAFRTMGVPVKLSATPGSVRRAAPRLGEHTERGPERTQGGRMMSDQSEKARRFRALHEAPETFVIANAWDAGSARILAALGFKALATSSGACAGVLGRQDGKVTRAEALAHCKAIVDATDLPVSADLEKGFGDYAGGGGRNDPARGGRRPCRRLDRGRDRRSGATAVRSRVRAGTHRRRGGSGAKRCRFPSP